MPSLFEINNFKKILTTLTLLNKIKVSKVYKLMRGQM
jgi:hypothetical protein